MFDIIDNIFVAYSLNEEVFVTLLMAIQRPVILLLDVVGRFF